MKHLEREREIGEEERERTKYEKIKKFRVFFANIHHRGATWHATSALDACVASLGRLVKHLMYFRDPDGRFESLGPKWNFATSSETWGAIYSNENVTYGLNTCNMSVKHMQHYNI